MKLSNGLITIDVADYGAELQSIRYHGREYLWQGDALYWGRRSPILFPMVGRLWDNTFRINGEVHQIGQHGFARDMVFALIEVTKDALTYELRSSKTTRDIFPYDFALRITYRLAGKTVKVEWEVENTGTKELPFQIGAHPAFRLPDFSASANPRAYFRFDPACTLRYISPAEKGCVNPSDVHTLDLGADGLMPIGPDTFDCDTYIFEDSQLTAISLLRRDRQPYLTVRFSSPLVAIWAPTASKPDCPFVCIEPWYGRCDAVGYAGEYTDREVTNHVAPGESFRAAYSITLDD